MTDSQRNGHYSKDNDTVSGPYQIDFECTAAPAESLGSLESGRLMLTVKLQGRRDGDNKGRGEKEVRAVAARLVNREKQKNLGNIDGSSELKRKTALSVDLARDILHPDRWMGAMGIPVTWTEGGTTDYERSGSWHPKNKGDLFAMEIMCTLHDGSSCTARFDSEDVYHWPAIR